MKYTQDRLRAAARRLFEFSEKALKAGRSDDASDLSVGADVLGACADNFGLQDSEIKRLEDPDSAASARLSIVARMLPVEDPVANQECCPFTKDGVCPVCRVFRGVFTVEGSNRRYICLSKWSKGPYG